MITGIKNTIPLEVILGKWNFYVLQEGRGDVTDISASPGRQVNVNQLRPKEPPPMVIQGDFRKVKFMKLVYK